MYHWPGKRIRIDMDRHTPFGRFVEVMDAWQFYNLTNRNQDVWRNYNRGSRLTVILSWINNIDLFCGMEHSIFEDAVSGSEAMDLQNETAEKSKSGRVLTER